MKPKAIVCRVMEAEFRAHMPPETDFEFLEISEHVRPDRLRTNLQAAVERADGRFDPIYLGYGLCSQAVVGLVAHKSRLVVFRTDDCIGIFLGSGQARRDLANREPGSYFLSSGWIGDNTGSVFDEYARLEKRWGPERAMKTFKKMMEHYTQLVHIVMPGAATADSDRRYAQAKAAQFGFAYVETPGTDHLIRRMAAGESDPDIAVFPPGAPITLEAMLKGDSSV